MIYDVKGSGERIRQLRIQNGYTQEKLAREIDIDRSLLSYVEAGKRGCSVDLLVRLSDFFNVSLDMIVLGKETNTSTGDGRELLKSDVEELIERLESFKAKL